MDMQKNAKNSPARIRRPAGAADCFAGYLCDNIMVAMKGFAWFVTGSVALRAFLDAIMDLSLSVMNFFVIRHAQTHKP